VNYLSFNHIQWLNDYNIQYAHKGKNIAQGWTGINCPFCTFDNSFHGGINNYSKGFSCWKCGEHGALPKLIAQILNITYKEAFSVINKYSTDFYAPQLPEKIPQQTVCTLPKNTTDTLLKKHALWLARRKFTPTSIFKKYKLKCTTKTYPWQWRLIVPYYQNKKILTFMGVDVLGTQDVKYKQCPINHSVFAPKQTLYNLPKHRDTVIVVEGLTDTWRMGENTVAVAGVKYTPEQVNLLSEFQRVFILFDADEAGYTGARNLANDLSTFVPHVEIIELEEGDPGDLTDREVAQIKNDVFGKLY